jgi:flagellar L-ring protein precursor FlgH
MNKLSKVSILSLTAIGCSENASNFDRVVPAVEFTKAAKQGKTDDFSIFNVAYRPEYPSKDNRPRLTSSAGDPSANKGTLPVKSLETVPEGYQLKKSIPIPQTPELEELASLAKQAHREPPPPASSAPYVNGPMTSNPSLWPDEAQSSSLFRDLRAFQPMDVVTITINEVVEGQKKSQTDAQSRFSILAAITNFFGFETDWKNNNLGFDPENVINATTNNVFQGTGQTKRTGSLRGQISAVVLEVLPNGLLRLEGSKIISVDNEEEVMVVSGLARLRDVDAQNRIESSRIANMRIDFYGKGVVADVNSPGWMTRLIRVVWPF